MQKRNITSKLKYTATHTYIYTYTQTHGTHTYTHTHATLISNRLQKKIPFALHLISLVYRKKTNERDLVCDFSIL